MNVFLTGATGFLGFSLSLALAEDGHRVTGLARDAASRARALRAGLGGAGVEILCSPLEDLRALPPGTECVIHAAGVLSHPGLSWVEAMGTNLANTVGLLRQAASAGVRRFVYVSSQSVYGSGGAPWSEQAPLRPRGPYAESKAAGEIAARAWSDAFEVRIARLSRLYGVTPRTRWDELPARLATNAASGAPIEVYGSGEQRYDLLHVEDAARGLAGLATRDDVPAGPYNLGSGGSVSLNELVEQVRELAGERGFPALDVVRVPDHPRGGFVHLELDVAAAARRLGWRAVVTLRRGLTEYLDALRGNGTAGRSLT